MRLISLIVVHCTDSPDDDTDINADLIHRWHKHKGWDGIGYHAVIKRDGTIEQGRPAYWQGAHAYPRNHDSLGVCLVGRERFTREQYQSLEALLKEWSEAYPDAEIVGHSDINPDKTCPNFNVRAWAKNVRIQKPQGDNT